MKNIKTVAPGDALHAVRLASGLPYMEFCDRAVFSQQSSDARAVAQWILFYHCGMSHTDLSDMFGESCWRIVPAICSVDGITRRSELLSEAEAILRADGFAV